MGTVFTNGNCVTGGGSLIRLTSGSCRCLSPPPRTHTETHTAQVVLLLWGPQSVYTVALKGQKASPHNANRPTLTGPRQVGTEIQIHTEMNRQIREVQYTESTYRNLQNKPGSQLKGNTKNSLYVQNTVDE